MRLPFNDYHTMVVAPIIDPLIQDYVGFLIHHYDRIEKLGEKSTPEWGIENSVGRQYEITGKYAVWLSCFTPRTLGKALSAAIVNMAILLNNLPYMVEKYRHCAGFSAYREMLQCDMLCPLFELEDPTDNEIFLSSNAIRDKYKNFCTEVLEKEHSDNM